MSKIFCFILFILDFFSEISLEINQISAFIVFSLRKFDKFKKYVNKVARRTKNVLTIISLDPIAYIIHLTADVKIKHNLSCSL